MLIDVTGQKGPNRLGRDVFIFVLDKSGHLYPFNGREHIDYIDSTGFMPGIVTAVKEIVSSCNPKKTTAIGHACAVRVVENVFNMDY